MLTARIIDLDADDPFMYQNNTECCTPRRPVVRGRLEEK